MILPTMSYSEISRAYRREINTAWNKIDDAALKFGGVVKKTRLYPVSRIYTIQTRDKTKIKLLFTAYKRSQWDSPLLGMYSTFFYKGGLHSISVDGPKGTAHIHTPHFWDRYRERVVKDQEMSTEDLIKRYMLNNRDMESFINTRQFTDSYMKYENEEVTQMAARIQEGNCFMDKIETGLYLIKTIISDDMLGDKQLEAFSLLEEKRLMNAEKYLQKGRVK